MRSETWYQTFLIGLGIAATALFGTFLYRELFPEYRIYQNAYLKLEEIRSDITGQPVPYFKSGIKQIVIPASDKGPETIDRCISCHVALKLEHFSPTKIARDFNGNPVLDLEGNPVKEPNESYIWGFLTPDQEHLKTVQVGEHTYDMTKVLAMHPLIGSETRPFEFHSMEEVGCVACHGGNGRGLVTDRSHGPVFDEQYEAEFQGAIPQFLEKDPKNDPLFSHIFNHKPGHRLLFQTTPLLIGDLMQARCVQCHQPTTKKLEDAVGGVELIAEGKQKQEKALKEAYEQEKEVLIQLLDVKRKLSEKGYEKTLEDLEKETRDYRLPEKRLRYVEAQILYLKKSHSELTEKMNQDLIRLLGSEDRVNDLEKRIKAGSSIDAYLEKELKKGSLFEKAQRLKREGKTVELLEKPLRSISQRSGKIESPIDRLTKTYQKGEELFVSQACYACHRIAGFARGGVGPELSESGEGYPWFIKESIVWPQADLKTSTMPNMRLDHEELEALMTYLLAQRSDKKKVSEVDLKVNLRKWEEGKKSYFEMPIPPSEIKDLDAAMTVYATQGCAACHRLKGFESSLEYAQNGNKEKQWFRRLFPEEILGSQIVAAVDKYSDEIDRRIVKTSSEGLLEKIEKDYPGVIESYYSNFKYALRAKNHLESEKEEWKKRVRKVLYMYIEEYGLGRLIGSPLHYSGIYRSDQWIMEHFWNPTSHAAKSIMPVLPFDNSKFLSLTNMLNQLAIKNRKELREVWEQRGFSPEHAYEQLCINCHGPQLQGNGPVSQWIYPIPKNLRNATYLRHLTKAQVKKSILQGVKGGPMPPWGEVASGKEVGPVLTEDEVNKLTDWIFIDLPGERVIQEGEVPRWQYQPEDILEELEKEGSEKKLSKLRILDEWWAALEPRPRNNLKIENVFTIAPAEEGGRPNYYIKEKFYTSENLQEGERFFNANCAVCHGRELDGAGMRAGSMRDAKPRMLTNLDWLDTRDDLRLLSSIKYGVTGTSMVPWGDMTTSLQRLQLVMYIRSMSLLQRERDRLENALYQSFNDSIWALEQARSEGYDAVKEAKERYEKLMEEREIASVRLKEGEVSPEEVAALYRKELETLASIREKEKKDKELQQLISLVKERKTAYESVGNTLLNFKDHETTLLLSDWIEVIRLYRGMIQFQADQLEYLANHREEIGQLEEKMLARIDDNLKQLKTKRMLEEAKIPSKERNEELEEIDQKIQGFERIHRKVISAVAESIRLHERELQIYKEYNGQI